MAVAEAEATTVVRTLTTDTERQELRTGHKELGAEALVQERLATAGEAEMAAQKASVDKPSPATAATPAKDKPSPAKTTKKETKRSGGLFDTTEDKLPAADPGFAKI